MTTAKLHQGFTLIELLIVLAITAILMVIAIPSYHTYLNKTHRLDAHIALQKAAILQEQYYFSENRYTADIDAIGGDGHGELLSPEGYYRITVEVDANDGFILTATPLEDSSQADDTACLAITLDNQGAKLPPTCW